MAQGHKFPVIRGNNFLCKGQYSRITSYLLQAINFLRHHFFIKMCINKFHVYVEPDLALRLVIIIKLASKVENRPQNIFLSLSLSLTHTHTHNQYYPTSRGAGGGSPLTTQPAGARGRQPLVRGYKNIAPVWMVRLG